MFETLWICLKLSADEDKMMIRMMMILVMMMMMMMMMEKRERDGAEAVGDLNQQVAPDNVQRLSNPQ